MKIRVIFSSVAPHSQPFGLLLKIFRHNLCGTCLKKSSVYVADSSIRFIIEPGIRKEYAIMARAKSPRSGNGRKAEVTTLPVVTSPDVKQASFTPDLENEIRRRAYELYEQRGCTPGQENEDWLIAEREVLSRYNHQQSA
jgi:Protein of unknown function (DUF2934)